jgi:hypothetical protein
MMAIADDKRRRAQDPVVQHSRVVKETTRTADLRLSREVRLTPSTTAKARTTGLQ